VISERYWNVRSESDSYSVNSPSTVFVPLPASSGQKVFDAVQLGLAPGIFYNVRVFATHGGALSSEASPTSALEVDDIALPAGNVTSFDLSGEASLAATMTTDAFGNLATSAVFSGTLSWDAENRLTGLESSANVPAASKQKLVFGYDWLNRRISKTVSNWNISSSSYQIASYLVSVWDGWRLQAELETNSVSPVYLLPREWYAWGLDLSGSMDGAGGVGGLLCVSHNMFRTNAADYFCASDAQGLSYYSDRRVA